MSEQARSRHAHPSGAASVVDILAFDVVVWVLATGRRALLLRPPALVFEVCGVPQSSEPIAEHSEARPERKYDYSYLIVTPEN